jgi:hypothetical protein
MRMSEPEARGPEEHDKLNFILGGLARDNIERAQRPGGPS